MMKNMKSILRGAAILFALAPLAAFAALVPCGYGSDPMTATSCGLCDLGQLIQNLINFLIGLSIPIAVGLFAWAGMLYFTSATEMAKIERAKSIFKSVLIGFIIVLSAWIIVQTLLNGLTGKDFFTNGSWNQLQCAQDSSRIRNKSVSEIFGGAPSGTVGGGGGGGIVSGGGSGTSAGGVPVSIMTTGADGSQHTITLNTTQNPASMQNAYLSTQANYGSDIQSACADASIPNCEQVVTSLIVAESGGNPQTGCNGSNSCGLMQLSRTNGGTPCNAGDSACISGQISKGVQFLNQQYTNSTFGGSVPNALAAYNGGNSTTDGTSPSGLRPALAASQDCSGLYAWQCSTNPGGLSQTQGYVANICALSGINGGSCQ